MRHLWEQGSHVNCLSFTNFSRIPVFFWREMEVLSAWDKIHQVIESTIAEKINDTKKEIRENLARAKNFEIKFRVIFYCNDRHWRQDMFPPNSEIFLISPSFLWFYILSRSATGEVTVCNFQSMKSPVELNILLSKFFCYISWLAAALDDFQSRPLRQILLTV